MPLIAMAAPPKGETDTWYLYASAQLADGKAIVYTTIIPITVSNSDSPERKAYADRACVKLKAELKEFVEREMNRKVTSVSAVHRASRNAARDGRDHEIAVHQAAGRRIIYLNGLKFAADGPN